MESILQRGEGRVKRLEGQLCLLLTRACAAQTLRAAELTAQELWSFPGNGGVRKRTSEDFVGGLLRLLFLLQLTNSLLSHQQTASLLADAALSKTALTLAWAWRKLSGLGSHGRIVHVTPSESVNGGFGFLGLRPGLRAAAIGVTCSARTSARWAAGAARARRSLRRRGTRAREERAGAAAAPGAAWRSARCGAAWARRGRGVRR